MVARSVVAGRASLARTGKDACPYHGREQFLESDQLLGCGWQKLKLIAAR